MLGDQLAQRGDGELVLAERQPGVDLVLERGGPQLLQPGGFGDRGRGVTQVLEWLAAPEPSPSVRRRYDTCTCRALTASASTCSPHTSSTRASADATFPILNSSAV